MLPIVRESAWRCVTAQVSALAVLGAIGCGGGAPAQLAPVNAPKGSMRLDHSRPAFFRGNEHFRASVALLGIPAGELDASISESCDGSGRAIAAVMLATMRTSGVVRLLVRRDGSVSTRLDPTTASPVEQTMEVHDGGPVRRYRLKFSPGHLHFVFQKGDDAEQRGMRRVPGNDVPFDLQSTVVLLRSWRPEPGTVGHFNVALGRGVYAVEVVYRGATNLTLDDKARRAVWLEGLARELPRPGHALGEPRHMRMWFSDDADRLPLRIAADADYGTAEFTLEEHEKEPGSCARK